jgi:hypothetical protein
MFAAPFSKSNGHTMQSLHSLPLWAVFIVTVLVFFAGYEGGHFFGRWRRERAATEKEELGPLVGALLGMLGFIIAITFGGQMSRFDAGRTLLLDEAAAVYTAFLRADMLPDEARDETRQLLYRYASLRADTQRDVRERIAESERIQQEIWDIGIRSVESAPAPFSRELYFGALNDVVALHQKRVAVGISQHMPGTFWVVLYVLAVLSFAATGYQGGLTSLHRSPIRPLAVLGFAILVALIADLDRQGQGTLRLNQAALQDVAARMATQLERRP